MLVFESSLDTRFRRTFDSRTAILSLRWHPGRKGHYSLPNLQAVFLMLAMTGWNDVKWYVDYRTVIGGVLLTCRRSEERPLSYLGAPFGIV